MENEIIESAYPARGNVLIVMGAEGRERALACARAVGFDGRWYDEASYEKALETRREFNWKFFTRYSRYLKLLDLTAPEDVTLLNEFCGEMGFDKAQKEAFFNDLACTTENPQNVIFVAELKDMRAPYRIKDICDAFQLRSIHVAWVLDGCSESDRMRILEFSRSMTEPEYSDEGTPIWSWSLNGDVWFIIPKDGGECEKLRIKESGHPIPDKEPIDESDDESKIDWSGLGDVVTKRYYERLKKEGLPPEDEGEGETS